MAVYAIGDVQGCLDPLRRLLDKLRFDPAHDRLWLTGDLVNRGPDSVGVLRLVRGLGAAALSVLGNHDLSLLAVAEGHVKTSKKDTYQSVLEAPDRDQLLDWLRRLPLLHHDAGLGLTLVHAGLPPQWDLSAALARAGEVEATLQGDEYREFLAHMFGREPLAWHDGLSGWERLRYIVNALTRMRYCHADGRLDLSQKGPLGSQPAHLLPWFRMPGRKSAALTIVCGHWAALGYHREPGLIALDTGCVWGNRLTALRLDAPAGEAQPLSVECGCRG
ncbi:MAG TPA: symmetrical bis(5'-nucleosyl)-tetraphosphatase [Candidatus Competibacteraceae bacterium]|nr:symmetrical bis(5'-nucleosyl)-tetraphosphatase [Candidatus Competibacteraceae bacterium]